MNHRQALQKAWYDRSCKEGGFVNLNIINPSYECGYVDGFNDAWDLLMAEIGPLVAELHTKPFFHDAHTSRHNYSVERLRELVREGGG